MIEYRRTIDDIQGILYSGGSYPKEALDMLAQDYAAACEEANERLRECQELLRKGLRAEAIQRCEEEPNLLDLVAALDFPERPQWCDLLKAQKLLVPPELLIEVAADLNTAYAQEQPLTGLMRQHRLLALARAPLRQRIATLRRIASADRANFVWQDDLKTYERVRHQQIQSEQSAAGKQKDVATLTSLVEELRNAEWLETPASSVLQLTTRSLVRAKADRAREELAALEPRLTSAHSNFDVAEARLLRQRWMTLAEVAGLMPDDSLSEMVAPALEWLEQADQREHDERQYQYARAELEQALDDERSRAELERLYHRLNNFQRDLPEALVVRYHGRLESLEVAAARRTKLLLVTIVGVVLLIAGLTTAAIVQRIRGQERSAYVAALKSLLDEDKLPEADQYVANLKENHPQYVDDPAIQELMQRLEGLKQQEVLRKAAFEKALSMARSGGVDHPNRTALDEAKRLAKTEAERSAVIELEGQIKDREGEKQDARDESFAEKLGALLGKVEALERNELQGYGTRLQAVQDLMRQSNELARQGLSVREQVRNNLDPVKRKLESMQRSELDQRSQNELLSQITNAVGDVTAFRERLAKYSTKFPDTERAKVFDKEIKQASTLWNGVNEWDNLIARWQAEDVTKLSPADAAARVVEANGLLTKHGAFPDAGKLRERAAYLEAIAARQDKNTKVAIVSTLDGPFSHFLVAKLHMVLGEDGKRYYSTTPLVKPKPDAFLTVKYLVSPDQSAPTKSKRFKAEDILQIGESPQLAVSRDAQAKLRSMSNDSWEKTFYGILDEIRNSEHKDPNMSDHMDPIMKVQLMSAVLDVACQGSHCFQKVFAQQSDVLRNVQIQGINWVDPNDGEADQVRAQAQVVIDNQLQFADAGKALAAEFNQLKNSPFQHRYRWIGWLYLDGSESWQCGLNDKSNKLSADLCVVRAAGGGLPAGAEGGTAGEGEGQTAAAFEPVGRISEGKVTLRADSKAAFVEGRPVYAMEPLKTDL